MKSKQSKRTEIAMRSEKRREDGSEKKRINEKRNELWKRVIGERTEV